VPTGASNVDVLAVTLSKPWSTAIPYGAPNKTDELKNTNVKIIQNREKLKVLKNNILILLSVNVATHFPKIKFTNDRNICLMQSN